MLVFITLFLFSLVHCNSNAILLKDVQVLTLHRGRLTTGRRSSPMAQLTCVAGSASHRQTEVSTVQCHNQGFNGRDYDWRCEAQLDKSLKISEFVVSCEGYAHPDDPYVLVGSCGLEYKLDAVIQPQVVVPKPQPQRIVVGKVETVRTQEVITQKKAYVGDKNVEKDVEKMLINLIVFVVVIAGVFFILAIAYNTSNWSHPRRINSVPTYDIPVTHVSTSYVPTPVIQQQSTIIIDRPVEPYRSYFPYTPNYRTGDDSYTIEKTTTTTTTTTEEQQPSYFETYTQPSFFDNTKENTYNSVSYGSTKRR